MTSRRIFQSPTITEATLVANLLREHGIQAQVVDKPASPWTAGSAAQVWLLEEKDKARAAELIHQLFSQAPRQARSWPCARCRESNPGSFEICWNCGVSRE